MVIKRQTYIWIIVALLALNAGTIITMLYRSMQQTIVSEQVIADDARQGFQRNRRNMPRQNMRTMLSDLQLDDAQQEQFRNANVQFREKGRLISVRLNELRLAMLDNMALPNPDTNYLNQLSDSVGFLHSQLKKDTYRYYMDINNICNNEQRGKLKSFFENEFSFMPSGAMHQQGHRMGRKNNNRFNN